MATQPTFERSMTEVEYLSTVFEHDCELVDGELEERSVGEFDHAFLQSLLGSIFVQKRNEWKVITLTEQRIKTSVRRFRVPDIAVIRSNAQREPVLTHPPLLVIEILSPEDTLRRAAAKAEEYRIFGIENIWVIDPSARVAYRATETGLELSRTGELTIPDSPIRIVLADLFAELDKV